MRGILSKRSRKWFYRRQMLEHAARRHTPPEPAEWGRVLRYGGMLLLATYLLFAHGCHADDEDHELCAFPVESKATVRSN